VHFYLSGDASFNHWFGKRRWIIWYKRSPSGITNLVWDPAANECFPSQDVAYLGYRDSCFISNGCRISKQVDRRRTMPTEAVSFSRMVPAYSLLQFWTLSVFYTLTDINVFEATSYLTDLNNAKCGFASLDGFEETTFFESKGPFEVILLSESNRHGFSEEIASHFNGYPKVVDQWTYYNVLLLEWRGGMAERRGFGHICQAAVENSLAPAPSGKRFSWHERSRAMAEGTDGPSLHEALLTRELASHIFNQGRGTNNIYS